MNNLAVLIISFCVSFGLLLIAMSAHEFAHGWVAYKLGDSSAKLSGRLTLNPLAHVDIFWTLILPLFIFISSGGKFVFGAAKPVPVNLWALKNPRRDLVLIGAAGPLANFIFAALLSAVIRIFPAQVIINSLFLNLIVINVVLGVFNLIPIPPLDGSKILSGLLPESLSWRYAMIEPYAFFILLALIWLGALDWIVWPLTRLILHLLGV